MIKKNKKIAAIVVVIAVLSVTSTSLVFASEKNNQTEVEDTLENKASSFSGEYTDEYGIRWTYTSLNDGTISISPKEQLSGNIIIPSKLDGHIVSKIEGMGYYGANYANLTGIKIPDTVTCIGEYAFSGCTNLSNVEIPASVNDIGGKAFDKTAWIMNQRKANSFVIVNGILIDGIESTGDIIIPANVARIASQAFTDSYDIRSQYVYGNSKKIQSVIIPKSVKKIDASAFNGCTNLSKVTMPNSLTDIGENAFLGTEWLNDSNLEGLKMVNGILMYGKNAKGAIEIPSNVTRIDPYAFSLSEITSIEIPSNVKIISANAFAGSELLKSVNIEDGVTTIGESAFSLCPNLKNINIPSSVTSIGNYCFSMSKNLAEFNWSSSVKEISYGAFQFCNGLVHVDIPDGITEIKGAALLCCENLISIRVPSSVKNIDDEAFEFSPIKIAYCERGSYASEYFKKKGIEVKYY